MTTFDHEAEIIANLFKCANFYFAFKSRRMSSFNLTYLTVFPVMSTFSLYIYVVFKEIFDDSIFSVADIGFYLILFCMFSCGL